MQIIRFQFLRCKCYVTAPEIKSPRGSIRNNYGMEITQISCKNYGAQK